jgi:hypothetical protein
VADPLTTLADRLDTLPLAVRQALVRLVETFGQRLLDLNRSYLAQGERPDGSPIDAGGYSPAYARYRAKYGKQTQVKDLDFTGEYYSRFVLPYIGGLRFEVANLDPKAAQLLKNYGELYGIREADIIDFITTTIEPEIRQVVAQHMQL